MSSVEPGTVLAGKYRVTKVLGEGGMGVVVAAVHVQLDEPVALKFMLPHALGSPEAVGRFVREARAAVKLKSEHVARVSDVGTLESGAPYIVMEYLEGTDLSAVLTARGSLSPEDAVDYIIQACDALAEAHSLGIVHRDLKPANLFLTHRRDGSPLVKVLDFGISKSTTLNEAGGGSLTKTGGGLMGSPLYMSPEQMKSAKDTDARTDVWALGVILYELVGGRTPFDADTLGGLMAQVLTEPPPPLPTLRPGLPAPLYDAIGKCLEKDRDKRWANVAELAMALGPIAPPRVHPLIERISGVLGHKPARTLTETSGDYRASLASYAGSGSATGTGAGARTGPGTTAAGWAEVSGAPASASGKRGILIAAAATLAIVVAIGGGLAWRHGAQPPPTPAILAPPPPETPATASVEPATQVAPAPARALAPSAPTPEALTPPAPAASQAAQTVVTRPPAAATGSRKKPPAASPPAAAPAPATAHAPAPAKPAPAKPPTDILDTSN